MVKYLYKTGVGIIFLIISFKISSKLQPSIFVLCILLEMCVWKCTKVNFRIGNTSAKLSNLMNKHRFPTSIWIVVYDQNQVQIVLVISQKHNEKNSTTYIGCINSLFGHCPLEKIVVSISLGSMKPIISYFKLVNKSNIYTIMYAKPERTKQFSSLWLNTVVLRVDEREKNNMEFE